MLELTNAEREIVESAREEFGEHLTQFLLAGLGEQKAGQGWHFIISYEDGEGTGLRRRVQVISHEPEDGSSCLPRGRDPLVFLALLQLFIRSSRTPDYGLIYKRGDVLKLLGWDATEETRIEVDEAINRYFLMSFKWGLNSTEMARASLAHYTAMGNIFSESETIDQEAEDGRTSRATNRVVFNPNFIGHLKRRSLFDLDWSKVTSVSYVATS